MLYEDLTPSLDQLHNTIRRQSKSLEATVQRASGGIGISEAPFIIYTPEDDIEMPIPGEYQIDYSARCDLQGVAEWVTDVDASVKELAAGVASAGRWNTVSTEPAPEDASNYREGSYWIQVDGEDTLIPIAMWEVQNRQWVEVPVPENTATPYLNTGLLQASVISSTIIKSDQFWTALGSYPRVGFNADGFQAYDSSGNLTVSINGIVNTLKGEFISDPWHLAHRGQYYGIFCRSGEEPVNSFSPGIVMEKSATETGWPDYFELRTQIWDTEGVDYDGGPTGTERIRAYVRVNSAHLKEGVTTDSDGNYSWDDIEFSNQNILARNASLGTGQSLWLSWFATQLEWRSPQYGTTLTLLEDRYELQRTCAGMSMPYRMAGGQYIETSGDLKLPLPAGWFKLEIMDDDDEWTTDTSPYGSFIYADKSYVHLSASHGNAQVYAGNTDGNRSELRLCADRLNTATRNSVFKTGVVSGLTLSAPGGSNYWVRTTVNIGVINNRERTTPNWRIACFPMDTQDKAGIIVKVISIDNTTNSFQVVVESVSGQATSGAGFMWVAINAE